MPSEASAQEAPRRKPSPVPPKPLALSGVLRDASQIAPRRAARYVALRHLATTLRIAPALLIPAVLWHVLDAATVSGAIVTLVIGGAVVAMTWTLAEIADTVRDLAVKAAA